MRIEGFDLQEPVVGLMVGIEELVRQPEAVDAGEILLLAHIFAVDHVVIGQRAGPLVELVGVVFLAQPLPGRLHHRLPAVAFLAAHELVAAEAGVIGGTAILEIMIMVGDQMAVDAMAFQHFRQRMVERLHRPPASVQEADPARLQIAPRRHAGQAADIMVVEHERALRQALEVRRRHEIRTVAFEDSPVEGIEQHEDGAHGWSFLVIQAGFAAGLPAVKARRSA